MPQNPQPSTVINFEADLLKNVQQLQDPRT
jgi:hypothetical protein